MPQKINLLEQLAEEQKQLEARRDQLLAELDAARADSNEEYVDSSVEDLLVKIQTTVDQLFKLENTIYELRIVRAKSGHLGQVIHVGDCVTLKGKGSHKQYYITSDSQYVNPDLGVISANSPIAQKLLNRKFGEAVELSLNGMLFRYQLIP